MPHIKNISIDTHNCPIYVNKTSANLIGIMMCKVDRKKFQQQVSRCLGTIGNVVLCLVTRVNRSAQKKEDSYPCPSRAILVQSVFSLLNFCVIRHIHIRFRAKKVINPNPQFSCRVRVVSEIPE